MTYIKTFIVDLKRAMLSMGFFLGVIIQYLILNLAGYDSELFRMAIPILCTLPYCTAFLTEYKSGFVKYSLYRSSFSAYILSKFFVCGISGGLCEVFGICLFALVKGTSGFHCELIFLCAFLWASVGATLAALSNSPYMAYGASFVIHYFLVILCERYWKSVSMLDPYEWYAYKREWQISDWRIVALLTSVITVVGVCYCVILKRKLKNV